MRPEAIVFTGDLGEPDAYRRLRAIVEPAAERLAEEIQRDICYLNEQTMGVTARLAIRDWGALEIPSSMEDLVTETSGMLQPVADIDLKANCGGEARPADTDQCTEALGS